MRRKPTVTLDERVCGGLHNIVGRGRTGRFIESLVRPHVIGEDLDTAYRQIAEYEAREAEALEWSSSARMDIVDAMP